MALAALQSRDEPPAIEAVVEALRHCPGDPRLWQVLGCLYRALDDLAPAMAAFDRAAALVPHDAKIAHGRARVYLEAGQPEVGLFDRVLHVAPNDGTAVLGRISARIASGSFREAIDELEAAVARNPLWAEGQAALARFRWMAGEHETFAGTLEAALRSHPGDLGLWRELLVALVYAHRYADVVRAAERGRAAAGSHVIFDANEAAALDELGERDAAARCFARLDPAGDATIGVYQIRHLLRWGRAGDAARLAEYWTSSPQGGLVWPYLATAWRLTGDPRWEWLEGDPRLVGVCDLGDRLGSLDGLARRLRSLHFAEQQPLDQSLHGGTQTDGMLFPRVEPEFRVLREAVVDAVQRHIAQLPPLDPRHPILSLRRDRPVRFSGSWSVRLGDAGRHNNHTHPGGWFSSALYVSLPSPEDRGPSPAGWLVLGEPPAELGLDLPPTRLVEPRPGRLVLFPSTMWHGTRPFAAGERLTVAFDVAPPR
jgi:tetratricopeptide (TPR) repeat protein